MKKKYILYMLILITTLFSCSNSKKYTINYIYENNIVQTTKYNHNDTFINIDYTVTNKVFKGYYKDENLQTKIDINNYKVTENMDVYLKYENYKKYNILYIPLDNRPVNKERAILLSESLNINLIIPEEDLYRTYLDNQLLNTNNTQIGNPKELLNFIKNTDINNIDAFIISLDQITSGGLVGSRSNYNTDITNELEIIEELIKIINNKPLYIIDTVMRLASTVGFDNNTINDYNNHRNYANVERYKLSEEQLTIQNIIKNYNIDSSGNEINYSDYNLSTKQFENYINGRIRKLIISNNLLEKINVDNTYYICGIDDSSSTHNIQKNEINYLKKINSNIIIFPGTDELGLMCISKAYQDLTNIKNIKTKINTFGNKYNEIDTSFDGISIKDNMESHLNALNVEINENDYDFEILLLTEGDMNVIKKLTEKMNSNFKNNIPACIIDASNSKEILSHFLMNNRNLSLLIGYSSWNTIGNSIGIALANSTARISYLKSDYSLFDSNCDEGFAKTMIFSFIKDIVYKQYVENEIRAFINTYSKDENGTTITASNNFYQYIKYSPNYNEKLKELMNQYKNKLLSNFIDKNIYSSLKNKTVIKTIQEINIDNYNFPWYRTFDISFNIEIKLK